MAKRTSYIIRGQTFPTKKSLQEHIRTILYRYGNGQRLNQSDFDFMMEVLQGHSDYEQKVGSGVAFMTVRQNPIFPTKGFWLHRRDGSDTDFSYLECLTTTPHRKRFERACRTAVAPTVTAFKHQFFDDLHNKTAYCPHTGQPLTRYNSHVDHTQPNTFQQLVADFIDTHQIDVDAIHVGGKGEDGVVFDYFTDKKLERLWVQFHNERAWLEIVSKEANLSLLRRGA